MTSTDRAYEFIRNAKRSLGYFLITALNQSLPFLILPVLTRYLAPDEYGNVALFSFYVILVAAICGSAMGHVVSKHYFNKTQEEIARIIGACIAISGFLALVSAIVAYILFFFFPQWLELPAGWSIVIVAAALGFVFFNIGLNVLMNRRLVRSYGKHAILNTVINLGLSLAFIIVLLMGWEGRAWGIALGYILSALAMLVHLKKSGYLDFSFTADHLRTVWKVFSPLMPNSIQAVIISQIGLIFMQYFYSDHMVGVYAIGYQIAFVVKLLITVISLTWTPYVFEALSNSSDFVKKAYMKKLAGVYALLVLGFLFVNLFSGALIRLMTTEAYHSAQEFVWTLSAGFLFHGFYTFLLPVLLHFNGQKFISAVSLISVVIMLGLHFWLIEVFGYMGIANAFMITYGLMFAAFYVKAHRLLPLPWLDFIRSRN